MARYGKRSFNEFLTYQESDSTGEDDADWLAENVACNLQKISQNVSRLEKLIKQIGTPQDSEELRDKVSQTTHYTNQLAKETNSDMKYLARLPLPSDLTEQRQLKMQRKRLREELGNVLKKFQTVQRTAAEKEKTSLSRAGAASSGGNSRFKDESVPDAQFSRPANSRTAQMLEMKNEELNLIREREPGLNKLKKDIMDIHQIFEGFGMLMLEGKGEVSDGGEADVEHAEIHVPEVTQQCPRARYYQTKAKRKLCCLIVVLMIILAIIGIIIAVVVSNNN